MFGGKKKKAKEEKEKKKKEKETGGEKESRPVTQEEIAVTLHGPAVYANKVYVTLISGGVRLSFTELREGHEPQFRAAVFMHPTDAIGLKDVLIRMLGGIEQQFKEIEQEEEKKEKSESKPEANKNA